MFIILKKYFNWREWVVIAWVICRTVYQWVFWYSLVLLFLISIRFAKFCYRKTDKESLSSGTWNLWICVKLACVNGAAREYKLSLEKFFSGWIINGGITGYQAKFTNIYNPTSTRKPVAVIIISARQGCWDFPKGCNFQRPLGTQCDKSLYCWMKSILNGNTI